MPMSREDAGRKGGKETLKRYGRQHFRDLGKLGIRALADKYYGGSIGEALTRLREKGRELLHAALVDEKLEKQIAGGAKVASVELPVVLEPEDDVTYWRDMERGRRQAKAAGVDLPF